MVSKILLAAVVISIAYESEAQGGFFGKWYPGQSIWDLAECSSGRQITGFEWKYEIKWKPSTGSRCAKYCLKERVDPKRPSRYSGITGSIFDAQFKKCECVVGGNPSHGLYDAANKLKNYCTFSPAEEPTTTTNPPTTTTVAAANPCEGVDSYYDQMELDGNCYVIPMMPADIKRSEAPRACERLGEGFHLAKITTQEIQDAMTNFITNSNLYDDFVYLWIDGTYNMGTGAVTLDDGSSMKVPKWATNHPKYVSSYTGMMMLIWYTEQAKQYNGIINYKEEMDWHTYALCDNS